MSRTINVILIDVAAQEVRLAEYDQSMEALQKLVAGSIEVAFQWPTGDVLYVDEDGLSKPQTGAFWITGRRDQPLMGNGVIIGREVETRDDYWNEPPVISLDQVKYMVRFVDRAHVDSWGKANASEPATTITTLNQDGSTNIEVVSRMGRLIGDMPKAKP